jgi:hypothetical protein
LKYHIREKQGGGELTVPDGSQLVRLVNQRLVEPDDEVRREGSEHWKKLREMPEFAQVMHNDRADAARFTRVLLMTAFMALALGMLYVLFWR